MAKKSKLEIEMKSKISLQEYVDSIIAQESRQPLKTLQDAVTEHGWNPLNPVCCRRPINIYSMIEFSYFAQCRVCGRFIADVAGPRFSKTGMAVFFADQYQFDDTGLSRTWIAGTELMGNA